LASDPEPSIVAAKRTAAETLALHWRKGRVRIRSRRSEREKGKLPETARLKSAG
jgi:hypothetical protein